MPRIASTLWVSQRPLTGSKFHHHGVLTAAIIFAICSSENGHQESLAILDGITSSVATSSFKPDPKMSDPQRHTWSQNSSLSYSLLLEQLDRYWALALAHTSSMTVPQHLSDVIAQRLKKLAQLSAEHLDVADEKVSSPSKNESKPSILMNAIIAAERSWTHPVIIEILSGKCTDKSQCEPQVVQQVKSPKKANQTYTSNQKNYTKNKQIPTRPRPLCTLFFTSILPDVSWLCTGAAPRSRERAEVG